jgi:hypothetical protein
MDSSLVNSDTISFEEWFEETHLSPEEADTAKRIRRYFAAFTMRPSGWFEGLPYTVSSSKTVSVDEMIDHLERSRTVRVLRSVLVIKARQRRRIVTHWVVSYGEFPRISLWLK